MIFSAVLTKISKRSRLGVMILQFIFPFHPQITLKVVIGKLFEKLEWSAHDKRRTKITQRNWEKFKRLNEIDSIKQVIIQPTFEMLRNQNIPSVK